MDEKDKIAIILKDFENALKQKELTRIHALVGQNPHILVFDYDIAGTDKEIITYEFKDEEFGFNLLNHVE